LTRLTVKRRGEKKRETAKQFLKEETTKKDLKSPYQDRERQSETYEKGKQSEASSRWEDGIKNASGHTKQKQINTQIQ